MIELQILMVLVAICGVGFILLRIGTDQATGCKNDMDIAWETQRLLGEILKELKKRG